MTRFTAAFCKKSKGFSRDNGGSIAIMAGLMFPLLVILTGGSVDMTRAYALKTKAQKTLDATVLTMARSRMSDDEIVEKGGEIFGNNLALREITANLKAAEFSAELEGAGRGDPSIVTGSATLESKSSFLGIFGLGQLEVSITSEALKPNPLPLEIAMVLDVSGSMNENLNGQPRIERLKDSTLALFDQIERLSPKDSPAAISLVPYSTSVNISNLGTGILEGSSVGGNPATGDVWAAERFRGQSGAGYDLSDESPETALMPFVTAAEIGNTEPTVPMQPLTDKRNDYRQAVEGLTADGYTSAHTGMIWGVYALSPKWKTVWTKDPKEYGEANKIIVLLTDGAFNTTHNIGARSNDDGDESNVYFQSACDLAKANGMTIYAVALSLDAASEARLSACASGSGGAMLSANSAQGLEAAFDEIGARIGGLRISG